MRKMITNSAASPAPMPRLARYHMGLICDRRGGDDGREHQRRGGRERGVDRQRELLSGLRGGTAERDRRGKARDRCAERALRQVRLDAREIHGCREHQLAGDGAGLVGDRNVHDDPRDIAAGLEASGAGRRWSRSARPAWARGSATCAWRRGPGRPRPTPPSRSGRRRPCRASCRRGSADRSRCRRGASTTTRWLRRGPARRARRRRRSSRRVRRRPRGRSSEASRLAGPASRPTGSRRPARAPAPRRATASRAPAVVAAVGGAGTAGCSAGWIERRVTAARSRPRR